MDVIVEAFLSLQGETTHYPQAVQVWMRVMALSFLASLLFVYPKPAARWILLALVLNIVGLIVGRLLFPEASRTVIGTCVHLMFWPAILIVIWRRPPILDWPLSSYFEKVYIIWISWASLLMAISILLDARTFLSLI